MLCSVFVYVDTDRWQDWFLTITLTTVVLINICNGIFQVINMMLVNFPRVFSQVATSQRYFPKGKLPKGISLREFFQVITSQMCNFPGANFPSMSQPQRPASIAFSSRSRDQLNYFQFFLSYISSFFIFYVIYNLYFKTPNCLGNNLLKQ